MTRLADSPSDSVHVFKKMSDLPTLRDRKVILLATALITDESIYMNGLYQNVYFLYKMFDAMGHLPILFVNSRPTTIENIPEPIQKCRIASPEDFVKRPIPVYAYIEIGMSIDSGARRFLKILGARTFKLYLGNILNIDTETPVFYPGMSFAHHVVGEINDVLVSPHYGQHAEYACALNGTDPTDAFRTKIGPYVWDASIFTHKQQLKWRPPAKGDTDTFVIMEPNISFQKSALIPLMILESWYRRQTPRWCGQVVVVNGERLQQGEYCKRNILDQLDLFKDGRILLKGRMDIVSVLTEYPSATFLCHQINNEFNYMSLEMLWAGFPLLHNATAWAEYGYSYKGSDIEQAAVLLDTIRATHSDNLETYLSHARTLAWKHSPYNPDVHAAWEKILNVRCV